jgi:nitrogen fixation NifU-like protein
VGPLEDHNGHARVDGPCGDTMEFWVRVRNGTMERVTFQTDGCGSSLACGSMTTVLAEGKSVTAVAALGQEAVLEALGGVPKEAEHCALLAINTLRAACADWASRAGGA